MISGTVRIGKARDEREEGCAARVVNGTSVWPQRLAGHLLAAVATLLEVIALSTPCWMWSHQQINATHTRIINSGIMHECQYWIGVFWAFNV